MTPKEFEEWWEKEGEAKAEHEAYRGAKCGGGVSDYQNAMLFAWEAGLAAGFERAAEIVEPRMHGMYARMIRTEAANLSAMKRRASHEPRAI